MEGTQHVCVEEVVMRLPNVGEPPLFSLDEQASFALDTSTRAITAGTGPGGARMFRNERLLRSLVVWLGRCNVC